MKGGKKARGFTIVETMIVLAVTGGLFVAIAATLSGRQQRTQFSQAVQEIQSQIQETINEVGTGFFPSSSNFTCTATLTGPQISAVSSTEQGANAGCIFLGKAVQFGVQGTDPEQFKVFTIAALQRTTTGEEVSSPVGLPPYSEAKPKVVGPPTTAAIDLTQTKTLRYGLTTLWARYGASNTPIHSVAFVNSLAAYSGSTIQSGGQQVRVVPITATSPWNKTQTQAGTDINNQLVNATNVDPADGIRICFVSGGSEQSGLITIGNNNRQLSVTLSIKGNKTCS